MTYMIYGITGSRPRPGHQMYLQASLIYWCTRVWVQGDMVAIGWYCGEVTVLDLSGIPTWTSKMWWLFLISEFKSSITAQCPAKSSSSGNWHPNAHLTAYHCSRREDCLLSGIGLHRWPSILAPLNMDIPHFALVRSGSWALNVKVDVILLPPNED